MHSKYLKKLSCKTSRTFSNISTITIIDQLLIKLSRCKFFSFVIFTKSFTTFISLLSCCFIFYAFNSYIFYHTFNIFLHLYIFFYLLNILFSFIAKKLNRYLIKISKTIAQINRVQIFKNILSSDFLYNFNFFTFSAFKHVRKRFLNNITVDTINKSTKTFKTTRKKSLNKKKILYFEKTVC